MPIPPTIISAKRRRHRKRLTATAPPPPAALQVIGVENVNYDEPVLLFTLVLNTTEDAPLVVSELDPAKWSGTWQGGGMASFTAEVAGFDRILVSLQGLAGGGGANTVSYAADPSDVSDTSGRTLAAFSDLPL
jgi:hypothetical protein